MDVIDFETYASTHGASRQDCGECGLHKANTRLSQKQWNKMVKAQLARDGQWFKKRDTIRQEYKTKIQSGELREPTHYESLVQTAQGHPDNESVQAARRILKKRFNDNTDWTDFDKNNY